MVRESTIEDYLCATAKRHNGEARKVKWIGRKGAPDRLVLLPDSAFFVELKRPGKDWQPHQLREAEKLRRSGLTVYLAASFEEIDQIFNTELHFANT